MLLHVTQETIEIHDNFVLLSLNIHVCFKYLSSEAPLSLGQYIPPKKKKKTCL